MVREAGADESVIRLKSLETFEKVADGNSTKIFIPSDLSKVASLASVAAETFETSKEKDPVKQSPKEETVNIHTEPDFLG